MSKARKSANAVKLPKFSFGGFLRWHARALIPTSAIVPRADDSLSSRKSEWLALHSNFTPVTCNGEGNRNLEAYGN